MEQPLARTFRPDEVHEPARLRPPDGDHTTDPLWEVEVYRGLFHSCGSRTVRATSKFEAECLVDAQLTKGEWFPTFSARSIASMPGLHKESAK